MLEGQNHAVASVILQQLYMRFSPPTTSHCSDLSGATRALVSVFAFAKTYLEQREEQR